MTTPEDNKALHIIELRSENVKRLRAVTIRPDGRIITIGGDNDQGKSSVLQSIEMAIGGGDKIIEEPIRRGAKKARTILDFGDIIVTRTYTKAGSSVTVTTKDGATQKSPQDLLNRLCSAVTFDPFGFTQLTPAKQAEVLRGIVKLDFTKLDADRKKHFDDRTLVNRELEQSKALVARLPFHSDAPKEEESSTSVVAAIENVQTQNQEVQKRSIAVYSAEAALREHESNLAESIQNVARLKAELAEAEQFVKDGETAVDAQKKAVANARSVAAAIQTVDLAPYREKLAGLEASNAKVRANKQHHDAEASLRLKHQQSDALTRKIEEADEQKQKLLQETKFPVAGLSFSENGVLLDGLPFDQAGDAEQIRVSVAIAAALNPRIRVMLIRDGSLIGTKKMELIRQLAEEHNLQVWIEVVSDSTDKKSSVVIEDGHIVGEEVVETAEPTTPEPAAKSATESQPELSIPPSV